MFIDTHAHLYSDQLLAQKNEILTNAANAGIDTVLMPAIDSQTHPAMLALEKEELVNCISMMGLHPCSVNENYKEELNVIEQYLNTREFIAIGETGLDFYWDLSFKKQQYAAFERQIDWAIEYNLPIVIHSRNSTRECIEVVSKYVKKGLTGVFHCFGGSEEEAGAIMETGFYLGIGGVLTFKKSGLDEVIKKIGLSRMVLETDAPYLAPVPYRGKRNEPAYIPLVAQKLADITDISLEEVAEITTANAKKIFGL